MKRLSLLLMLLFPVFLFSQVPESYKLYTDDGLVKALSSRTPLSNSISDIIARGDTIWLGTSRGVSLSTDNGESWTTKTFGNENVICLRYDKYHNMIWVSTGHLKYVENIGNINVGSGLHYTTDNGVNWTDIPQPVDSQADSLITYGINDSVRALQITVLEQNIIWNLDFTPHMVWIASWAGGIRRSSDMGQTWQRVLLPSDSLNSLQPTDTVNYALSPQSGKFGQGWNNFLGFSVVSVEDSTIIYAGTANGINKTTDAESKYPSWQKFNHQNQTNGISGDWVWELRYNKEDNSIWCASWKANGVTEYFSAGRSADGGQSWNIYIPHERLLNIGFNALQPLLATEDGVFRSSNGGLTWILPGIIKDSETGGELNTTAFYAATASGNTIWLGSDHGLARLTEGSSMWSGQWKVYIAAPESKEVYAFPNPFSPKIDTKITFKYDTGAKEENVTIRIFDFGMNYLKTVIQNAPRNIASTDSPYDFWDGTDDNGSVVPNGVYFYRIEVGSDDPQYGKILVLQ